MQSFRCPLAKTGGNDRTNAITYGNNHIKIIIRNLTCNFSITFLPNLSEFPTSCLFLQFALLVNVFDMLNHICT